MEKFGIFELLDTLSAILGDQIAADVPAPPAEKKEPSVTDAAFLPPAYEGGEGKGAFTSFLDKHDETVKRVSKKTKP